MEVSYEFHLSPRPHAVVTYYLAARLVDSVEPYQKVDEMIARMHQLSISIAPWREGEGHYDDECQSIDHWHMVGWPLLGAMQWAEGEGQTYPCR